MPAAAATSISRARGDRRAPVVIKTLSTELRADAAQLERFLMEDWVAQRIEQSLTC